MTLTETTNLQPSNSESSAFFQLDERIRRWIWQAGWTELKDAQERAIPIILEGQRDVIIAAATASGKTEAAYFPILTRMLAESESCKRTLHKSTQSTDQRPVVTIEYSLRRIGDSNNTLARRHCSIPKTEVSEETARLAC